MGRVQVSGPNSPTGYGSQKHSLTLIGRVTNPSIQKVWSLIPFFTEHWKADILSVGSDLGMGMFHVQFELESDLLTVLEKHPYHYARWMVILQRWEPTISPSFPSMIPFWIKIQGVPIHLWSEEIAQSIGNDIGTYESAEITSQCMRMRVHVNGRLPIIKSSVIEYPNGDEVLGTLLYEKLERHCSTCGRLDHEIRDCLEEKHLKKAKQAAQEKDQRSHTSGMFSEALEQHVSEPVGGPRRSPPRRDNRFNPYARNDHASRSRYSTSRTASHHCSLHRDTDQRDKLNRNRGSQDRGGIEFHRSREESRHPRRASPLQRETNKFSGGSHSETSPHLSRRRTASPRLHSPGNISPREERYKTYDRGIPRRDLKKHSHNKQWRML